MSRTGGRMRGMSRGLVITLAAALASAPLAAAATETPAPTTEPEATTTAEPATTEAPTEPLPTPKTNTYAVGQSVQFRMNAEGEPNSGVTDLRWAVTQITVQGPDAEELQVPVPEQSLALRSLLDFSNPPQQDGVATYDVSVSDGYGVARSVGLVPADYQLPVAIDISFTLDGQSITAAELVGKSGVVTAQYTVKNLTRATVDVPITATGSGEQVVVPTEADVPMVVIAKTLLPQRYTGLNTGLGQFGADGRGNNQVQWITLPFSPLAKDGTSTFGWAANVTDAVIPSMLVQVAPLYIPPAPEEGEAPAEESGGRAPVPGLDPVVAEIQAGLAQVAQGLDGFANSDNPDPLDELEANLNAFFSEFSANLAQASSDVNALVQQIPPLLTAIADAKRAIEDFQNSNATEAIDAAIGAVNVAIAEIERFLAVDCAQPDEEGNPPPPGTVAQCRAAQAVAAELLTQLQELLPVLQTASRIPGALAVVYELLTPVENLLTNVQATLQSLADQLAIISQGAAENNVDLPTLDTVIDQVIADVVASPNGQLVTGGMDQVSAGVGQAKIIVSDYVAGAIAQIQAAGADAAATTDTVKAEMGGISVAAQASPLPYGGDPANAPEGTVLSGAYEFRLDAADTNEPNTPARIILGVLLLLGAGGLSYLVARRTKSDQPVDTPVAV